MTLKQKEIKDFTALVFQYGTLDGITAAALAWDEVRRVGKYPLLYPVYEKELPYEITRCFEQNILVLGYNLPSDLCKTLKDNKNYIEIRCCNPNGSLDDPGVDQFKYYGYVADWKLVGGHNFEDVVKFIRYVCDSSWNFNIRYRNDDFFFVCYALLEQIERCACIGDQRNCAMKLFHSTLEEIINAGKDYKTVRERRIYEQKMQARFGTDEVGLLKREVYELKGTIEEYRRRINELAAENEFLRQKYKITQV